MNSEPSQSSYTLSQRSENTPRPMTARKCQVTEDNIGVRKPPATTNYLSDQAQFAKSRTPQKRPAGNDGSDSDLPACPDPRKRPSLDRNVDNISKGHPFQQSNTTSGPPITRPMNVSTSTRSLPPRVTDGGLDGSSAAFQSRVNSPDFRKDLTRRMRIVGGTKKEMEQIKRERRQWVLEECLKRCMDLRQSFNSWSYETRMYPAIKAITAAAPPDWGWDRTTTRDIIRTLCWDRVRSQNRRIRSTGREVKKRKPNGNATPTPKDVPRPVPRALELNQSKAKATREVVLDSSDNEVRASTLAKPPKAISRARIPTIDTKAVSHATATAMKTSGSIDSPNRPTERYSYREMSVSAYEESQEAQRTTPASIEDTFEVHIRKKRHVFARDIEYEEFDNAVQCVLTIEQTQMRCYRALSGSKNAREWKPLEYPDQFVKMVICYADNGVEVGIQEKVKTCLHSFTVTPLT